MRMGRIRGFMSTQGRGIPRRPVWQAGLIKHCCQSGTTCPKMRDGTTFVYSEQLCLHLAEFRAKLWLVTVPVL